LFGIVVAVVIQSVFRLEMLQNDVFFFFNFIFEISTSKQSENIKKNLEKKKKNLNFEGMRFQPRSQTR
jgi:hypothetical protein